MNIWPSRQVRIPYLLRYRYPTPAQPAYRDEIVFIHQDTLQSLLVFLLSQLETLDTKKERVRIEFLSYAGESVHEVGYIAPAYGHPGVRLIGLQNRTNAYITDPFPTERVLMIDSSAKRGRKTFWKHPDYDILTTLETTT